MNQSGRPITCTAVDTCVINQSSQFNATSWLLEYPALLCFDDAGSVNLQTRMVEARDAERWGGRAEGTLGLERGLSSHFIMRKTILVDYFIIIGFRGG